MDEVFSNPDLFLNVFDQMHMDSKLKAMRSMKVASKKVNDSFGIPSMIRDSLQIPGNPKPVDVIISNVLEVADRSGKFEYTRNKVMLVLVKRIVECIQADSPFTIHINLDSSLFDMDEFGRMISSIFVELEKVHLFVTHFRLVVNVDILTLSRSTLLQFLEASRVDVIIIDVRNPLLGNSLLNECLYRICNNFRESHFKVYKKVHVRLGFEHGTYSISIPMTFGRIPTVVLLISCKHSRRHTLSMSTDNAIEMPHLDTLHVHGLLVNIDGLSQMFPNLGVFECTSLSAITYAGMHNMNITTLNINISEGGDLSSCVYSLKRLRHLQVSSDYEYYLNSLWMPDTLQSIYLEAILLQNWQESMKDKKFPELRSIEVSKIADGIDDGFWQILSDHPCRKVIQKLYVRKGATCTYVPLELFQACSNMTEFGIMRTLTLEKVVLKNMQAPCKINLLNFRGCANLERIDVHENRTFFPELKELNLKLTKMFARVF